MNSSPGDVTMKDIARVLHLDPSTVSLSLKGDLRLKASTREKVRACAERLGYVPHPMLSALSHYRHTGHLKLVTSSLAFLCPVSLGEMRERHAHFDLWEGARACALSMGYRLELFKIDHDPDHARQLERILHARGITGIIYAPILEEKAPPPIHWENYSVILIEGQNLDMQVHKISNDQTAITREAVARLDKKGYRRIGLAVGSREEESLRHAFSAGYYIEMALRPHLDLISPFYLAYPRGPFYPEFRQWMQRNRCDVVLSNWDATAAALREAGYRVPEDIAVASLDHTSGEGANAGMRQNSRAVGARALEQLSMLVKSSQRGFITTPNTTLIPGTWIEGSDLPDKVSA